jgi:hypothetical protein
MRRAALVVVVLAACGDGGGDDDGSSGTDDAHQFCVDETNRLRAMHGRPAVERDAALEAYADEGAEHDHHNNPHDHFLQTQGGGIAFAENECPHWDLSFGGGDLVELVRNCIDAFYDEGPGGGHYDNMMGDYAALGCGIYIEGTDVTIIQDFGP